jgi:hypothetical protein
MMPFTIVFDLTNSRDAESSISKITYDIDHENHDLERCLILSFDHDFAGQFGRLEVTITAPDSSECRSLKPRTVTFTLSILLNQLEPIEATIELSFSPTPPRFKRLLFDYFHQVVHPQHGYIAEDDYEEFTSSRSDTDRLGDHLFTNFQKLYEVLTENGYYVETLSESFNCFDA